PKRAAVDQRPQPFTPRPRNGADVVDGPEPDALAGGHDQHPEPRQWRRKNRWRVGGGDDEERENDRQRDRRPMPEEPAAQAPQDVRILPCKLNLCRRLSAHPDPGSITNRHFVIIRTSAVAYRALCPFCPLQRQRQHARQRRSWT